MSDTQSPGPEDEQPFVSHLIELRDRILRAVITVFVIFLGLFAFANDLYVYLAEPLMAHLPDGGQVVAVDVASPFLTPFKLALVASVFLAVPVILHQLWSFVAPGLYQHEKRLAIPLLISSVLLFYAGMAFAYYVVFPLVFDFLSGTAPEGVSVTPDISRYLDFVLTLFFAFGIAFEVPIATILLVLAGITTPDNLVKKRPYVIVGAFVIGMVLTPPDVISQTLLAFPMWILFEVGVIFARLVVRQQPAQAADSPEAGEDNSIGGGVAAAGAAAATVAATDAEASEVDEGDWQPMSDAEMEAELDAIEAEEDDDEEDDTADEAVDNAKQEDSSDKPS